MIADKQKISTTTGNLQGEEVAMTIDTNAMAHIMGILTDLYSDPELAVIREYSTNARDAHVEAGQTRPIEVSLPGPLSPFFTVEDWGVGLSIEDIHNIYSKYGASTKRDTNAQTGMLGLGCKSALTYASQFTLIGTKDGVRCQVVVARKDDGTAAMTVADTSATDDPDGVKVIIPGRRHSQIEAKAREFFRYWPADAVLIDGAPPRRPASALKVTDDLHLERTDGYAPHLIVMGGVTYPVASERASVPLRGGFRLVAHVPIGAVNFTPNREALHYTDRTLATLRRIQTEFEAQIGPAIARTIQDAPTGADALERAGEWQHALGSTAARTQVTWRGHALPDRLEGLDDHGFALPGPNYVLSRAYAISSHQTPRAASIPRAVYIHGYSDASWSAPKRRKLDAYCDAHGIDRAKVSAFILQDARPTAEQARWLRPDRVIDWADVKAIQLAPSSPHSARRRGAVAGTYDTFVSGSWREKFPAKEIDTSKPIVYIEARYYSAQKWVAALARLHPQGYTLVALSSTRTAKFCRSFPTAEPVRAHVQAQLAPQIARLTPDDTAAYAMQQQRHIYQGAAHLPLDKLDDPRFQRQHDLLARDVSALRSIVETIGWPKGLGEAKPPAPLTHVYPLLAAHVRWTDHTIAHAVAYVNAVYAAGLTPAS